MGLFGGGGGGAWAFAAGAASALAGAALLLREDARSSAGVASAPTARALLAVALVAAGAAGMVRGHGAVLRALPGPAAVAPTPAGPPRLRDRAFVLALIYLGTLGYTAAAYYHLRMDAGAWTFARAFVLAAPVLLLVEYQCSLRGNRAAQRVLGMSPVQVVLVTMAFYFVNAWLLNALVLRQPTVWWRDALAFALVLAAFALTGVAGVAPPTTRSRN